MVFGYQDSTRTHDYIVANFDATLTPEKTTWADTYRIPDTNTHTWSSHNSSTAQLRTSPERRSVTNFKSLPRLCIHVAIIVEDHGTTYSDQMFMPDRHCLPDKQWHSANLKPRRHERAPQCLGQPKSHDFCHFSGTYIP